MKILDGTITPTVGHVNIGKTVKFAVLSQRLDELEKLGKYKIKEVLSRYKPSYIVDGKETTPGQMMERLGFESAQLMTPIKDLSGGQKRRDAVAADSDWTSRTCSSWMSPATIWTPTCSL